MKQADLIIPDPLTPGKRNTPRVLGVIPARLASTRLPRKVLRSIAGHPMLVWVYAAARACPHLHQVVVAVDSDEVADLCRRYRLPFLLTSPSLPSGSDRVHAVSLKIPADIYVNVQADEPLLRPEHLSSLLQPFGNPGVHVTTLRTPCAPEDVTDPNSVKVVSAPSGRALYFSRAPIPFHRDTAPGSPLPAFWKHLGLYAYTADALHRFTALPPSPIELTERLEQLRFLENNIPIHVETTPFDTVGVDTEADLQTVEAILRQHPTPRIS